MSAVAFVESELLAEARAAAKLDDFGGDEFLPGLRRVDRTGSHGIYRADLE